MFNNSTYGVYMENEINDESLASEDWKCLFLITLVLLVLSLGYIIECKLSEPVEYCTKDFCIKERR